MWLMLAMAEQLGEKVDMGMCLRGLGRVADQHFRSFDPRRTGTLANRKHLDAPAPARDAFHRVKKSYGKTAGW